MGIEPECNQLHDRQQRKERVKQPCIQNSTAPPSVTRPSLINKSLGPHNASPRTRDVRSITTSNLRAQCRRHNPPAQRRNLPDPPLLHPAPPLQNNLSHTCLHPPLHAPPPHTIPHLTPRCTRTTPTPISLHPQLTLLDSNSHLPLPRHQSPRIPPSPPRIPRPGILPPAPHLTPAHLPLPALRLPPPHPRNRRARAPPHHQIRPAPPTPRVVPAEAARSGAGAELGGREDGC